MKIVPNRPSQWRAQLGALGFDKEAAEEPEARAEALLLKNVRLPRLALPAEPSEAPLRARRLPLLAWLMPLAGVAAAVLFLVLSPARDSDLHVKGGSHVSVFWERDQAVHPLGAHDALRSGDRIRAEIQAGADGFAYWLVVDEKGRMLVPAEFAAASELSLRAGERAAFAQSLRLDGEPVGETLIVVICNGAGVDKTALASRKLPPRCATTSRPLR